MSAGRTRRVAVFFHSLGPYHFSRLRAAGKLLTTTAIEVSAVDDVYAWNMVPGEDGFKRITVFTGDDARKHPAGEVMRRVRNVLDELRPEVVAIPGWSEKEALAALRWCAETRTPSVLMSDSTAWDDKRVAWKEWVKRSVVALCGAGLVAGAPQLDYLAGLGMDRDRIFVGYDTVDNEYFEARAQEVRERKPHFASEHGLPECYFLTTARFVKKKNLLRLIQAYERYRRLAGAGQSGQRSADDRPWDLVLMGDGPLKLELCQLIAGLGLEGSVHLTGFRQYEDIPAYYGLASAFILASTTDQWGLVVNEAMASGLPVLVSDRCGCARDLVHDGVNGLKFDPYNEEQIAQSMFRMASSATGGRTLEEMGKSSQEIIKAWGSERFAQGLHSAVESALKHPRPRLELFDRFLLGALIYR